MQRITCGKWIAWSLVVVLAAGRAPRAKAATVTRTWTGGEGNWTTASKWG